MTDAHIKHMANRFLCWKLPEDFNPDAGISFKAEYNDTPAAMEALGLSEPSRHQPTGTNLLNFAQAEEMVRHMLEGLPDNTRAISERERALVEALSALEIQALQSSDLLRIDWGQEVLALSRAALAAYGDEK